MWLCLSLVLCQIISSEWNSIWSQNIVPSNLSKVRIYFHQVSYFIIDRTVERQAKMVWLALLLSIWINKVTTSHFSERKNLNLQGSLALLLFHTFNMYKIIFAFLIFLHSWVYFGLPLKCFCHLKPHCKVIIFLVTQKYSNKLLSSPVK